MAHSTPCKSGFAAGAASLRFRANPFFTVGFRFEAYALGTPMTVRPVRLPCGAGDCACLVWVRGCGAQVSRKFKNAPAEAWARRPDGRSALPPSCRVKSPDHILRRVGARCRAHRPRGPSSRMAPRGRAKSDGLPPSRTRQVKQLTHMVQNVKVRHRFAPSVRMGRDCRCHRRRSRAAAAPFRFSPGPIPLIRKCRKCTCHLCLFNCRSCNFCSKRRESN